MKKALFIALALVVAVAMLSACGGATQGATGKATFGMVTDTGGIGDKSFNDAAWAGFTKAAKETGLKGDPPMIQSAKADDYIPNLTAMAAKADLTIGVGFMMQDAIKQVATKNPNKKFATIDTVVDLPNVRSQLFAEEQGSFLVGVAAGLTTKSNVVGFVGGMESDLITKFEVGFKAGVKSVNANAQVLTNYTGSFSDAALGKQAALTQFDGKADVIYHASGGCGIGVIAAADEKGFWAIGVDSDQAAVSKNNKVLCSMIKRVDTACYSTIMDTVNGKFSAGTKVFDLKADGVGVSDNGNNLSADIKAKIESYKAAIISGKIKVPTTQDELKAFTPVAP